jgi:hypothetical protein
MMYRAHVSAKGSAISHIRLACQPSLDKGRNPKQFHMTRENMEALATISPYSIPLHAYAITPPDRRIQAFLIHAIIP